MANITLLGASYTDVPAVDLPKTGGGTVRFYEDGGGGGSSGYTRTVVVPEQTVTPTYADGRTSAILSTPSGTFAEDDEYIVTFNGDEYWFTCVDVDWGGFRFIGAEGYLWGTSSQQFYPCLITYDYDGSTSFQLDLHDNYDGVPVTIKVEKIELTGSGGGGGYDIPTFTITFDSNYSTVLSVTCDKTYAECLSIFNSGNNTAMSLVTAQGTSDEFYGGVTVTATGTGVITYTGYNVAHPAFDIVYNSNGTMSYVEPSAFVDTLNITENGTYYADGDKDWTEVNVNVPSGGASNIVTGTFTGTTAGQTVSVRLNYSGTGYPIAYMIYPSEGMRNANGTFNTTLQRYAIRSFTATMDTLPLGMSTEGSVVASYKNSASSATSYTSTGSNANTDYPFTGSPSSTNARSVAKLVKGSNGTVLYAYIASNSYGFMANVEYTYVAIFG